MGLTFHPQRLLQLFLLARENTPSLDVVVSVIEISRADPRWKCFSTVLLKTVGTNEKKEKHLRASAVLISRNGTRDFVRRGLRFVSWA